MGGSRPHKQKECFALMMTEPEEGCLSRAGAPEKVLEQREPELGPDEERPHSQAGSGL